MTAREEILGRVSAALSDVPRSAPGATSIPREYAEVAVVDDLVALFVERVEDYRAIVERVRPEELPAAVAAALGDSTRVVVPPGLDPSLLAAATGVDIITDDGSLTAAELDRVDAVVTAAAVGIAVTGTIVLDHAPDQGRRALSLVPDRHVCIVRTDQLVGDVPEGVAKVASAAAGGRPLTWISGPSATSDIELERVEGVHGPRRLHVLLVG